MTIDELNIEINADSENAANGLEKIIAKLKEYKAALPIAKNLIILKKTHV